ncbi:hypothetical protein Cfor_05992 [Coptotermes formosanus]|uniref:Uncharacterized protein n=1 Tax=Coptotermes formosanus TaxID=36987 RepID=A0A6L2P8S7_COPFO|nr:hypothetical protein Cfor_05992 [Coptotermes formosanus]
MSGHFSEHVATLQNMHLSPTLIILAKATLAFPFCYHYASGIRHLGCSFLQAWDLGKFLTIKEVYLTGYSVLANLDFLDDSCSLSLHIWGTQWHFSTSKTEDKLYCQFAISLYVFFDRLFYKD